MKILCMAWYFHFTLSLRRSNDLLSIYNGQITKADHWRRHIFTGANQSFVIFKKSLLM